MSMRPCCQVRAGKIKHRCLCCQDVSVGSKSAGARSLQGALQVPDYRALICFLHRKEVAVQRRGVTAGAEVHRCLGAVGRLQREREVLCAWSGDSLGLRARLLSPCWDRQLSSGSASARVPGLVGTSTQSYDPDPEYMSLSPSVLSSPPGVWGPERHQHGPPLGRRRTDAAVTADMLGAGTPTGTLPPRTHLPADKRQKTTKPRRPGLMAGPGRAEGPLGECG